MVKSSLLSITVTSGPPPPPPSTFTVTVLVIWTGTGVPISGATVKLTGTAQASATSGADGKAVFNNAPAGTYTAWASAQGYDLGHTDFTLTKSQTVEVDLNRTVTPPPLSINVTASPGTAPAGTPVSFTAVGAGGSGHYIYTWTFDDATVLEGSTVTHSFGAAGTHVTQVSMTDTSSGQMVAGTVSTTTTQITPGTYAVAVGVSSSFDLSPIPGATVTFGSATLQTDASGQAVFKVGPGTYNLSVSASGYVSYSEPVTINQDTTLPIVLTLTMGTGGGGGGGVIETVSAAAILPTGASSTNPTYSVGQQISIAVSVPNGGKIPVSVQGFVDGTGGQVFKWDPSTTGYRFVFNYGNATVGMLGVHAFYAHVTFVDGSTMDSNAVIIAVAQGPTSITVHVLSSYDNSPIANASVNLGGVQGVTDASGNVVLNGVPTGTLTLIVSASGFNTLTESVAVSPGSALDATLSPVGRLR